MSFETSFCSVPENAALPLSMVLPEYKVLAAFTGALGISLLQSPKTAALAIILPLTLAHLSAIPKRDFLKKMLPVNIFFLFLWLLLPLRFNTAAGGIIYSMGPVHISLSGIKLALLISLKGNAMAALLLALCGTSTAAQNAKALLKLRVPEKLVAVLLLTYNNLHLMHEQSRAIRTAAKLRAFKPRTNLSTYRSYAYMVARILILSLERSDRVGKAMMLKGFKGRFPVFDDKCVVNKNGPLLLTMVLCCCTVLKIMEFNF